MNQPNNLATEPAAVIKDFINKSGVGSAKKLFVLAGSASAGNRQAAAELESLLGLPMKRPFDYYMVISESYNYMTFGERQETEASDLRSLRAGLSIENDADEYLANKLGKLRRAAGMTQAELSKRSGVTLTTLQKLENGSNRILGARTEIVLKIASALNLTIEELVNHIINP